MDSPGIELDDEPAAPSMARSSLLRELPTTPRGLRTRAALVAAARKVFERRGYLETRLSDITTSAKCSAGTFYTYFGSKEEIFAAVLEVAQEDMMHPGMPRVADDGDPAAIIAASNRAYFDAYRRNAKLMILLEQVANIDTEFRTLRRLRGEAFIARNARSIQNLQERGLADPVLDPLLASQALSGMVSRLAFSYFSGDDTERAGVPLDDLVDTATRLWVNALRVPTKD